MGASEYYTTTTFHGAQPGTSGSGAQFSLPATIMERFVEEWYDLKSAHVEWEARPRHRPTYCFGGVEYDQFDLGDHGRVPKKPAIGTRPSDHGKPIIPLDVRIATARAGLAEERVCDQDVAAMRARVTRRKIVRDGKRHEMRCLPGNPW